VTGRRLVLLRHGRTEWNHARRVQGQTDVDLDEVGEAQAEAVGPAMAALEPALLWSSDLTRARRTAEAVGEATGLAVRPDPRLREIAFGEREGFTHEEFADLDPDGYAALRRGEYHLISTAEPLAAVQERMLAAVSDVVGSLEPGRTGVVVSHGAAIRIVVGALLAWPGEQFGTLGGLENCAWVELSEHPYSGRLLLHAYNRTAG
jgi:probable phosphoglycerate mutase